MTEELVRRVVLAAVNGERGDGGWLKIDAPEATDREISLAIMEASERGLVEGCNVSDMQSAYPEWRLVGPTGASTRFLRANNKLPKTETAPMSARDVFVIHGRDERLRSGMFDFLNSLDLHPMEWEYAVQLTGEATPYVGQVLDAAFSHAQAVVVLFTPDDVAMLRPDLCGKKEPEHETDLTPQSRPNVLFEAGMAMARSAERTILVEIGALRPFSDAGGRHTIRMDNSVEKRKALALRLRNAGCAVNLTGDWERRGDLSVPKPWNDLEHKLKKTIGQQNQSATEPQLELRQVGAVNYYFVGDKGPFCQACYDGKGKLTVLSPQQDWNGGIRRRCSLCKEFSYEKPMDAGPFSTWRIERG